MKDWNIGNRPYIDEVVKVFAACLDSASAAAEVPMDYKHVPPVWSVRADALRRFWIIAYKSGEKSRK